MRGIGFRRPDRLEVAWLAFALVNVGAMLLWPTWETIPFHLIWLSLTLLYGFRVWALKPTFLVLIAQGIVTGWLISHDAMNGTQEWGELFEVPLMSAMFLAMVWHARRHQRAAQALAVSMRERAEIVAKQENFLHDVSHEMRTPITIARGHLEILRRSSNGDHPEVSVAIDELSRMERIVEQLLLLVRAGQADFAATAEDIELDTLIEDVVMRWAGVAPRVWQVGSLASGTIRTDRDALRIALDALVENAVAHTGETDAIELCARAVDGQVAIDVADEGAGISPEVLGKIFERFGRADSARARSGGGGVGLGLSIVDAIARGHGGRCIVRSSPAGSTFTLILPGFRQTTRALVATSPRWSGRPVDEMIGPL
jgi:signal transduction histidine kinase